MRRGSAIARHLLIALLGIWLGALVSVGAAAAIAFPTMKRLDPTLPGFEAVGEHWSIAAGSIFQPLFLGVLSIGTGIGVVSTFIAMFVASGLTRWWRGTLVGLVFLATMGAAASLILAQAMSEDWQTFLAAARSGDAAAAALARDTFDRSHPISSKLLEAQAFAVLLGLILAVETCRVSAQLRAKT